MFNLQYFKERIFSVDQGNFVSFALSLFRFQAENNWVYKAYIQNLNVDPGKVEALKDIPFLPIEFFKTQVIKTGLWEEMHVFESSGTTGQTTSRHFVEDLAFYHQVSVKAFSLFYGAPQQFQFLALLPSYLEREGSSLVLMVDHFISLSQYQESGFYLDNLPDLVEALLRAKERKIPVILLGVTFALLDLAEIQEMDLNDVTMMETGGMKGRRKEMIREELHEIFRQSFKVADISSEYGMTELLSQGYATKDGEFQCPPWMQVLVRDLNDPFNIGLVGKSGGINVIDLANVHSCAFIETKDIGVVDNAGKFRVLGRFDNTDIRGCNLLVL